MRELSTLVPCMAQTSMFRLVFSSPSLYFSLSGRSNLNLKMDNSSRINCKGGRITTAIISLPAPPDLSPDGDGLHGPVQRRPPSLLSHAASPSIQTTASSAGVGVVKVSALWPFGITLRKKKWWKEWKKRTSPRAVPAVGRKGAVLQTTGHFRRRQVDWKHRWGRRRQSGGPAVAASCMYCRYGQIRCISYSF